MLLKNPAEKDVAPEYKGVFSDFCKKKRFSLPLDQAPSLLKYIFVLFRHAVLSYRQELKHIWSYLPEFLSKDRRQGKSVGWDLHLFADMA